MVHLHLVGYYRIYCFVGCKIPKHKIAKCARGASAFGTIPNKLQKQNSKFKMLSTTLVSDLILNLRISDLKIV